MNPHNKAMSVRHVHISLIVISLFVSVFRVDMVFWQLHTDVEGAVVQNANKNRN